VVDLRDERPFENLGAEAPWNEVGAWGVCRMKK